MARRQYLLCLLVCELLLYHVTNVHEYNDCFHVQVFQLLKQHTRAKNLLFLSKFVYCGKTSGHTLFINKSGIYLLYVV